MIVMFPHPQRHRRNCKVFVFKMIAPWRDTVINVPLTLRAWAYSVGAYDVCSRAFADGMRRFFHVRAEDLDE